MNDRNFDHLLSAWMDLGPTAAPDRVANAARLEVRTTRQLPAILDRWAPRRFPEMNTTAKVILGSAAVVVALLLGYNYLVAPNVGGPRLVGSEPTPSPSQTPAALATGPLAPGRYAITDVIPSSIVITVPSGWQKNTAPAAIWTAGSDAHMGFSTVDNVYTDPCAPAPVLFDPAIGPTVDDLAAALQSLPGIEATSPTAVTVGGLEGTELEITATDGLRLRLVLWRSQPFDGDAPVTRTAKIWILDVGRRASRDHRPDRPVSAPIQGGGVQVIVDSTLELAP